MGNGEKAVGGIGDTQVSPLPAGSFLCRKPATRFKRVSFLTVGLRHSHNCNDGRLRPCPPVPVRVQPLVGLKETYVISQGGGDTHRRGLLLYV